MKLDAQAPAKRRYRMGVRAEATAATRRRILEALVRLGAERFVDEITLDDVADRAGVTVPTVLRHFGSRNGLLAAAAEEIKATVLAQRSEAPVGDIPGAVANLVEHYERWGDRIVRLLAQEERVPVLRTFLEEGRAVHREWTERTFAPFLRRRSGAARRRLRAQLVAACDVYMWKLLRRDLGLGRGETERALVELLTAVTGGDR
jgi:AcrR family transcriptional regulator